MDDLTTFDLMREYIDNMFSKSTEEFEKLERNAEKIRYCHERLQKNMIIGDEISSGKNENLAIEARKKGNKFFIQDKDYVRALEHYNKSICLSPSGSENIGICYANRSAIYFQSGLFKFCLENIELAVKHNYPERLTPKLAKRKKECLQMLTNDNYEKFSHDRTPVKLSYPGNKHIPFLIEGLELQTSEEFGRHICANHDLYPGDVVVIENPYIKCLEEELEYIKCTNCLQSNFLNLIPCQHCTKAMYCGTACEQMAWKRFHKYECNVIEGDPNVLAIRATLVSFTLSEDCAKLKGLIDSLKKKPVTGFDLNYEAITEEEIFKVTYCLATNASKSSVKDNFKRSNVIANSWHALQNSTNLRQLLKTTEEEDFFLDTLLHFSQLNSMNSHALYYMSRTPIEEITKEDGHLYTPQTLGSALFPIISLLNHSCAPNVIRINRNGATGIMVLRNIKSGDQLFDNYEGGHMRRTKEERQVKLAHYLFTCQCEACLGDYPLVKALIKKDLPKFDQVFIGFYKISEYNRQCAMEYFQKSKHFLKEFNQHYPAYEVCAAQSLMISCMRVLFDNTPLELQLIPCVKDY